MEDMIVLIKKRGIANHNITRSQLNGSGIANYGYRHRDYILNFVLLKENSQPLIAISDCL